MQLLILYWKKTMSKPSPKPLKAESHTREKLIAELLLEGRTRSYITEYCEERFKIKHGAADDLINKATKRIQEINMNTLETNLATITNNQWDLYRKAVKEGNLSVARAVLMDMAKLRGLDSSNINVVIEKREHQDLSDEELDKLLNGDT